MSDEKLKQIIEAEANLGKGLAPHAEDPRDHDYSKVCGGIFSWFGGYTPKKERVVIDTLTTKNQTPLNTCGWSSVTLQKEKDEGVPLAVQFIVMVGKQKGKISGNGFSSLRDNQDLVQKYGVAEQSFFNKLDTANWEEYSDHRKLTKEMFENAYTHRSASYARVYGEDNVLQALDNGRILQTGLDWYSGFNMGNGFSAPWLILKAAGVLIGGHAVCVVGYDLNYQGKKVLIFKNSIGSDWGDKGLFYVEMGYALENCYAFYTQTDVPVDTAKFLNDFQFKFVKGKTGSAIYQILGSEKLPFADPASFFIYADAKDFSMVEKERIDNQILASIPTGNLITVRENPARWNQIKALTTPDRWKEVQKYLAEDKLKIIQ